MNMKSTAIIAALIGSASAFAPASMVGVKVTVIVQNDELEARGRHENFRDPSLSGRMIEIK
jgi:hypothetical protein